MLPQRLGLRLARQARPSQIRSVIQRRLESSSPPLRGPEDNAFNRERKAVKDHAAATSGKMIFTHSVISAS